MISALWVSSEEWVVPSADALDVRAVKRGDRDALSALMARYQNRLYRYLLRWAGDQAVAEDLFQATWLRVIQKIGQFDPRRSFGAWLFTVARNLAIDHVRRYRPEALENLDSGEEPGRHPLPATLPKAFDLVLAAERTEFVRKALETQPTLFREVLSLRFEEEMKLAEIAEVLDIPLSTVKSRLSRALERLRSTCRTGGPKGEL